MDIFIGGAWPYSNYYLHIGHLAALLPGDVLARYYRIHGDNVIYVSGSDCHGTPITQRALKENVLPSEIATFYHNEFVKTFNNLNFEYDEYSNTMTTFHKKYVMKKFKELINNGYIYEKQQPQDYCPACNKFLSDREIVGTCPHCGGKSSGDQCDECCDSLDSTEVLDKHCKLCNSPTIMKKNKHLFFKLTKFEDVLQNLIDTNKERWRKNAIGEAQKYLNVGLVDRAATRQLDWGIPVPVENYDDKRIYVWIEAVLGYLSVGQEVAEKRGIDFDKFMSDDNQNLRTYYVHGKDNIPFHTTIYPALISGLDNNYRLPDYIISSAYVNLNNNKMAKSTGNLITANELLNMFTSDTIRYYFLFKGPETSDINCSISDIAQTHNKFLVGMLGNFVNRNLSYMNKNFSGIIKEAEIDKTIIEYTEKIYKIVGSFIEKGEFKNAINYINEYVTMANKYYDSKEPWNQVKNNIDEFNKTTYTCAYIISNLANLIYPFIPDTANKIKSMLSLKTFKWEPEIINGDLKINDLELLFQRIKVEEEKQKQKNLNI